MQLLASDTDAIGQARLDVHVDIFQCHRPFEFAAFDFTLDDGQAVDDGVALGIGEHARFGQHGGVGDGATDVLSVHALVKVDAGGEGLDKSIGGLGEAATPELVLLGIGHDGQAQRIRTSGAQYIRNTRGIHAPAIVLRAGAV